MSDKSMDEALAQLSPEVRAAVGVVLRGEEPKSHGAEADAFLSAQWMRMIERSHAIAAVTTYFDKRPGIEGGDGIADDLVAILRGACPECAGAGAVTSWGPVCPKCGGNKENA